MKFHTEFHDVGKLQKRGVNFMDFPSFAMFRDIPIRLALGAILFSHGTQELFGWFGGEGYAATVKEYEDWGLKPGKLMVLLAGSGHAIGALMVLFGLGTRIGAFLIAFSAIICIFKIHLQHGFFLNWKNISNKGHGIEYHLAVLGMTLSLIAAGSGPVSIDYLLYP